MRRQSTLPLLCLVAILAPSALALDPTSPSPLGVVAVETQVGTIVSWLPPKEATSEPVTYRVYGVEGSTLVLLDEVPGELHTQVSSSFVFYAVSAVVGGVESSPTRSTGGVCVDRSDGTPPFHVYECGRIPTELDLS